MCVCVDHAHLTSTNSLTTSVSGGLNEGAGPAYRLCIPSLTICPMVRILEREETAKVNAAHETTQLAIPLVYMLM